MRTESIKRWLKKNRHQQKDIARELGVSRPLVCRTVNGTEPSPNKRVLEWLLEHGCPEKYLDFPMKKAA